MSEAIGGFGKNAQLAVDLIAGRTVDRLPTFEINPMEWRMIDRLAGVSEGRYRRDPVATYRRMYERVGVSMVDQWIPTNPLSMGTGGYESDTERTAMTGAAEIRVDGMPIDSPEAVIEHIESHLLPGLDRDIGQFDHSATVARIVDNELKTQRLIGRDMLKTPYGGDCVALGPGITDCEIRPQNIPNLMYGQYGYDYYLMAYALYPEVMDRVFARQADYGALYNAALVAAMRTAGLPRCVRLDHDMADGRGTLVDERTLDRVWFPHFARAIAPLVQGGVTAFWHCDGNLMAMVPRLIEAGVGGFQGFQYEHGMDYERICSLRARDGQELLIVAGVSVTRTLPYGTPSDVRDEMRYLVEHGPKRGLFLGASSSSTPGVPWENLEAFVEGLRYYRTHGRTAHCA